MKKVLIYAGPELGDKAIVLPAAKALKRQWPDCKVDLLLCADRKKLATSRNLISILPYIDNCYSYYGKEPLRSIITLISVMINKYDYGVILYYRSNELHSKWPFRIMRFSGICTVGVESNMDKMHYDFSIKCSERKPNQAEAYLQLIGLLGVKIDDIMEEPLIDGNQFILKNNINLPKSPYLVIAVGCGEISYHGNVSDNKSWGVSRWLNLAKLLNEKGLPVVFIGGEKERIELQQYKAAENRLLYNYCGKTSLSESLTIIHNAALLLSADTGMMHFAAALGIKTLSLFGCTDPKEYLPPMSTAQVVYLGLECSPCLGYERSVLCKNRNCMRLIDEDTVLRIVERIL